VETLVNPGVLGSNKNEETVNQRIFYVCQNILKGPGVFWKRATIRDEMCPCVNWLRWRTF